MKLQKEDSKVFEIIEMEKRRQREGLELIPSESYASLAVLEAMGSVLNNKYAENYPGEDYHVNVQPYSGSPANLEVYFGLLEFGDTIMSLRLDNGGHLTHGSPSNLSGKAYKFVHYGLKADTETIDYDELYKLAKECKPKIILSGFTAYPRIIDFKKVDEIAKEVGALSMADISHISGLVIAGVHPSPFPFTDIITTTTHKTLRGPRGAMIFCKQELKEKIDKGVFPGMQGGPHEHSIAGIAVALNEAIKPEFKDYAQQTVKNSKVLAKTLMGEGLKLMSDGTDNHLMVINLVDFGKGKGVFVEKALEAAEISVNKSTVPNEPSVPYYPSGIRLGTPAVTSRGMKEKEMEAAGKIIARVVKEFAPTNMPETKEERNAKVKEFKEKIKNNSFILQIKKEVNQLVGKFPVPGIDS